MNGEDNRGKDTREHKGDSLELTVIGQEHPEGTIYAAWTNCPRGGALCPRSSLVQGLSRAESADGSQAGTAVPPPLLWTRAGDLLSTRSS